jgi:hypothetical protein
VQDSQVTDHDGSDIIDVGNDGGGDIIDGDNNGDIIDVGNSGVSDPWEVQLDTSVFGDVPTAANQLDMTMLEVGMVSILNGANGMDGMDGMDNNGPDGSGNNNGNGGFLTAFVPPPPPTQLQLKIEENQVSVHDVLMGRKGRSNSYPGNRRYLKEARRMQMQYAKASNYREKMNVSQELINLVRQRGGRFLQLDFDTILWNEVDNQTARKKARDALRDHLRPGRQGYVIGDDNGGGGNIVGDDINGDGIGGDIIGADGGNNGGDGADGSNYNGPDGSGDNSSDGFRAAIAPPLPTTPQRILGQRLPDKTRRW